MNQILDLSRFQILLLREAALCHTKNPDIFELIRGKCNILQGVPTELTLLTNNLPSGYHREMQLTKEVLFPAINTIKDCLYITEYTLNHIQVKR